MLKRFWSAEPAAIMAFVNAVIGLVMAFGFEVDAKLAASINTVVIAFLAVITRSQVTSPATLQDMSPKDLKKAQALSEPARDVAQKLP